MTSSHLISGASCNHDIIPPDLGCLSTVICILVLKKPLRDQENEQRLRAGFWPQEWGPDSCGDRAAAAVASWQGGHPRQTLPGSPRAEGRTWYCLRLWPLDPVFTTDGPGLPVVVTVLLRARCSAAAAVSPSATGLALQGSQVGLTYGHPSSSLPGHDPSSPSAG
ncbi:unnamed protein product [Rangifer tarandus platyrhynchus]|uniref:Uncharacterized protein n=1 Tax=Rangifer tarandus platyrhynchus TaxID=3082113 RepID=A0ABN8Y2M8_RANTA|nr:unnamed protein product [Rangifer tarandus platyrhynchus]